MILFLSIDYFRKKNVASRFLILTLLFLTLILSCCEPYGKIGGSDENIQGALPPLLRGEWVFIQPGLSTPAERYLIEENTIHYGYGSSSEGRTENDGAESEFDFKGTIHFVSNFSSNSGVIIIEYFDSHHPSYAGYNGNLFFAVYYRNLKNDTVQLANAINLADLSAPDTATLEEAIAKFTRMKMGSFVDWGVVQHQSRVRQ
ncbi:MAG: hypothetical protein FWB73_03880 [Treponema sp.]|nr:hypothetical protein [Treponema sp.]